MTSLLRLHLALVCLLSFVGLAAQDKLPLLLINEVHIENFQNDDFFIELLVYKINQIPYNPASDDPHIIIDDLLEGQIGEPGFISLNPELFQDSRPGDLFLIHGNNTDVSGVPSGINLVNVNSPGAQKWSPSSNTSYAGGVPISGPSSGLNEYISNGNPGNKIQVLVSSIYSNSVPLVQNVNNYSLNTPSVLGRAQLPSSTGEPNNVANSQLINSLATGTTLQINCQSNNGIVSVEVVDAIPPFSVDVTTEEDFPFFTSQLNEFTINNLGCGLHQIFVTSDAESGTCTVDIGTKGIVEIETCSTIVNLGPYVCEDLNIGCINWTQDSQNGTAESLEDLIFDISGGTVNIKISDGFGNINFNTEFQFKQKLPGDSCNDGDECTDGETYNTNCGCDGGVIVDADQDGICANMDCNDATLPQIVSLCPGEEKDYTVILNDGDELTWRNSSLDLNCDFHNSACIKLNSDNLLTTYEYEVVNEDQGCSDVGIIKVELVDPENIPSELIALNFVELKVTVTSVPTLVQSTSTNTKSATSPYDKINHEIEMEGFGSINFFDVFEADLVMLSDECSEFNEFLKEYENSEDVIWGHVYVGADGIERMFFGHKTPGATNLVAAADLWYDELSINGTPDDHILTYKCIQVSQEAVFESKLGALLIEIIAKTFGVCSDIEDPNFEPFLHDKPGIIPHCFVTGNDEVLNFTSWYGPQDRYYASGLIDGVYGVLIELIELLEFAGDIYCASYVYFNANSRDYDEDTWWVELFLRVGEVTGEVVYYAGKYFCHSMTREEADAVFNMLGLIRDLFTIVFDVNNFSDIVELAVEGSKQYMEGLSEPNNKNRYLHGRLMGSIGVELAAVVVSGGATTMANEIGDLGRYLKRFIKPQADDTKRVLLSAGNFDQYIKAADLLPNQRTRLFDDLAGLEDLEDFRKFLYSNENGVNAWKGLFPFQGLRTNTAWLERASKWIDDGLELVEDGVKVSIKKDGNKVGEIIDELLHVKYPHYGGDVVTHSSKTTTVLGKWQDPSGGGTSTIINSKLSKSGSNPGGVNALNETIPPGWSDQKIWDDVNKPWLESASSRGDVIRAVSDPNVPSNIYKPDGTLSFFGRENEFLTKPVSQGGLGYTFDASTFNYVK